MTLPAGQSNPQYLYASPNASALGSLRQNVASTITYSIDYSGWLASGETITAVSYEVFPATSPALAVTGSTISGGNIVTFQLSGGIEGTKYEIMPSVTTSAPHASRNRSRPTTRFERNTSQASAG